MADENIYQGAFPEGERVGFCQDCGKPLTAATIRTVGSGVFCEPCLERRIGTVPGAGPASAYSTGAPGSSPAGGPYFSGANPPANGVFPPLDGSTPHPMLAGFLGLIPGVGAMYNGQFAKGILHLIIFAVLVSLSDNVNGIFGLLVAGWIFFMAFEAYHTAKARRDGLPLPDVFGWNNIGERFGLRNWSGATRPAGNSWNQPSGTPVPGQPDWVGYVPPSNFATTPPANPAAAGVPPMPPPPPYSPTQYAEDLSASIRAQAVQDAGYSYAPPPPVNPYTQTYTGAVPPADAYNSIVPVKRFPTGAIWLIGLGLLFLIGNIDRSLRLSMHWVLPIFLGGVAIWMFVHRFSEAERMGRPTASLVCSLRAPSLLMTLAVLFALQTASWLTLGQTWPIFFIVLGGLLLLERTLGRPTYLAPMPMTPPVPPPPPVEPARWATATDDSTKAGEKL